MGGKWAGMAWVPAWSSGRTSIVQPSDTDMHALLRENYRQGMGSGLFKTISTERGTFHETANELRNPETLRRGGGVQIGENPYATTKEKPRKTRPYHYCVGCNVHLGPAKKMA